MCMDDCCSIEHNNRRQLFEFYATLISVTTTTTIVLTEVFMLSSLEIKETKKLQLSRYENVLDGTEREHTN